MYSARRFLVNRLCTVRVQWVCTSLALSLFAMATASDEEENKEQDFATGFSIIDRIAAQNLITKYIQRPNSSEATDEQVATCLQKLFSSNSPAVLQATSSHLTHILKQLPPSTISRIVEALRPIAASVTLKNIHSVVQLCFAIAILKNCACVEHYANKVHLSTPLVSLLHGNSTTRSIVIEDVFFLIEQYLKRDKNKAQRSHSLQHVLCSLLPFLQKLFKLASVEESVCMTDVLHRFLLLSQKYPSANDDILRMLEKVWPVSYYNRSRSTIDVLFKMLKNCEDELLCRNFVHILLVNALNLQDSFTFIKIMQTIAGRNPETMKGCSAVFNKVFHAISPDTLLIFISLQAWRSLDVDEQSLAPLLKCLHEGIHFSHALNYLHYLVMIFRTVAVSAFSSASASLSDSTGSKIASVAINMLDDIGEPAPHSPGDPSNEQVEEMGELIQPMMSQIQMLKMTAFRRRAYTATRVLSVAGAWLVASSSQHSLVSFYNGLPNILDSRSSDPCSIFVLSGFYHPAQIVRETATSAYAKVISAQDNFTTMPVVMDALAKETIPQTAEKMMRIALCGSSLLKNTETGKRVLNQVYRLSTKGNERVRALSLSGLGHASANAPQIAFPFLLRSIDKVNALENIPEELQIGACQAILVVMKARPSRGVQVVPFLQKVIDHQSKSFSSKAAALAFASMAEMTTHGVLNGVKTIKIVLKSFPKLKAVPKPCRCQYIHLLSSVADADSGKKGRKVMRTCVEIIRDIISKFVEETRGTISRSLVTAAAVGLCRFDVNDVLRISYEIDETDQEQLSKIETEVVDFVHQIINSHGLAALINAKRCCAALQLLLEKIYEYEWEQRPRGIINSERLLRLKSSSQKLREKRNEHASFDQAVGSSVAETPSNILANWTQAVDLLPEGVIKLFHRACSSILNRDESDRKVSEATYVASIRAIRISKGLVTALPWAALLNYVIMQPWISEDARVCSVEIAFAIQDDNSEVQNVLTELQNQHVLSGLPDPVLSALSKSWIKSPSNDFTVLCSLTREPINQRLVAAVVDSLAECPRKVPFLNEVLQICERVCVREEMSSKVFEGVGTVISANSLPSITSALKLSTGTHWSAGDVFRSRVALASKQNEHIESVLQKILRCQFDTKVSAVMYLEMCRAVDKMESAEKNELFMSLIETVKHDIGEKRNISIDAAELFTEEAKSSSIKDRVKDKKSIEKRQLVFTLMSVLLMGTTFISGQSILDFVECGALLVPSALEAIGPLSVSIQKRRALEKVLRSISV